MTDPRDNLKPLAINAQGVAALLGVSARQVWAMHQAGTLRPEPVNLGQRLTRWDRQEIEEKIKETVESS